MAKKQQIILTHGTGVPTYDKSKFAKGELLVRHASDEKDAALYTANDGESAFIAFPSKAYVDDQITKVDASGIGAKIDALDSAYKAADKAINDKIGDGFDSNNTVAKAISAETTARENADNAINAKFGTGIGTGENEKTVAAAIAAEKERAEGVEAGLQAAVNLKVAQADYDVKVGEIESDIDALQNVLEGYSGKGSVKIAVDSKVAQADYDTKVGEIDDDINAINTAISKLNETYATDDELAGVKTELEDKIKEATTTLTVVPEPDFGIKVVKTTDSTDKHANYALDLVDVAKDSDVTALSGKVNTLIGSDNNMSARAIVQDEVALQLKSENISESFDTLKEMAEWLSSHPEDVTEMQGNIEDINNRIGEGFGTTEGKKTVAQTITDVESSLTTKINDRYTKSEIDTKVNTINDAVKAAKTTLTTATPDAGVKVSVVTPAAEDGHVEYKVEAVGLATSSELDALGVRVKTVEDDYLKGADKTELSNSITTEAGAREAADAAINAKIGGDFGTTEGKKTVAETIAAEAKTREDEDTAIKTRLIDTITITNTAQNNITATKKDNTVTFNFDAMVIDGGEY